MVFRQCVVFTKLIGSACKVKGCLFVLQVRYASLTEAVRLLGCFSGETDIQVVDKGATPREESPLSEFFYNLKESR